MLVAFRTDASTALGAGHVMRCAALASALRQVGGRSVFLCAADTGNLNDWLLGQGHAVHALAATRRSAGDPPWQIDAADDAERTLRALGTLDARPDWLVIDHYGIDARWLDPIRTAVDRVLLIDDLGGRSMTVDAVLDVGLQAECRQQQGTLDRGGRCLLGPRYALLRPEFASPTLPVEPVESRPRLLACMGGSDPQDALGTVLSAWQQLDEPRPPLDMAVGAATPHLGRLRERCSACSGVTLHVQSDDMAGLMARADWLIGSAGGISWERCAVGLPAILGSTADNQLANLQTLARLRTGIAVGNWAEVTPERLTALLQRLLPRHRLRQRMAARARRLVDGAGALRVALYLAARGLDLRPAADDDATDAFAWRNAASTRRHSFDPRPLTLAEHVAWWSRTLTDPTRTLRVAQIGHVAVGVLRLDHGPTGAGDAARPALVSVYLDPRWVGLGLGTSLLEAGQRWVAEHTRARAMRAEISPLNGASIAAFENVGFTRTTLPRTWEWRA